ncbi:MAG: aldehyde dehydrogenase family protein [Kiritimatiellae bacterium]|nr:aldehyde dehydrogenase family protein [Kiritimatiellia bacterium]
MNASVRKAAPPATETAAPEVFRNWVGGQWREAGSGLTFDDENPAHRNSAIARFQASEPVDMRAAVEAAAAALPAWRGTALGERQTTCARLLDLLKAERENLATIVCRENGKTIREARAEVDSALIEGRHHVNQASAFGGHTLPISATGMTGWVQYHPVGVVGIVSPWNYPVNVMCRKAIPALLMGNAVVFKPASYTPWSGIFMAALTARAGLPPGVFNCVTGAGSSVGDALVDDARVRAISFTGSTAVGKRIQQRAAANLTRTQLELGGKNALIVMDDADLEAALTAVMTAGFGCAGQWCTATSRLLLHDAVHDRFLDMLARRCERLVLGDPLDEHTEMGPVAGFRQFEGVAQAIATAEREGARKVTGGVAEGALAEGYFVRPTVFAGVTPDMAIFRDEIFGPVLAVVRFRDLDEALALANRSVYGLSSGIFTQRLDASLRYIAEIEAGVAHVNMHTGFKDPSLPFGGWKESGYGPPENARQGLEFFVEAKSVYLKHAPRGR